MKAIVTFSYFSGSMYSEHLRYFEAETEEELDKKAKEYQDKYYPKSNLYISEIGECLDEFGSQYISSQNM